MAFNFNGTTVDKVIYNGQEIDSLYFNGVEVYVSTQYRWNFIAKETSDPGLTTYDVGSIDSREGRYYLEYNYPPAENTGRTVATSDGGGYEWNVFDVEVASYRWKYIRRETSEPAGAIDITNERTWSDRIEQGRCHLEGYYPAPSNVGAEAYIFDGREYYTFEVMAV